MKSLGTIIEKMGLRQGSASEDTLDEKWEQEEIDPKAAERARNIRRFGKYAFPSVYDELTEEEINLGDRVARLIAEEYGDKLTETTRMILENKGSMFYAVYLHHTENGERPPLHYLDVRTGIKPPAIKELIHRVYALRNRKALWARITLKVEQQPLPVISKPKRTLEEKVTAAIDRVATTCLSISAMVQFVQEYFGGLPQKPLYAYLAARRKILADLGNPVKTRQPPTKVTWYQASRILAVWDGYGDSVAEDEKVPMTCVNWHPTSHEVLRVTLVMDTVFRRAEYQGELIEFFALLTENTEHKLPYHTIIVP
ncbi:MAG: hypothetical protein ABIG95_00575 [Candidatus Woesearchaeota archaeon]